MLRDLGHKQGANTQLRKELNMSYDDATIVKEEQRLRDRDALREQTAKDVQRRASRTFLPWRTAQRNKVVGEPDGEGSAPKTKRNRRRQTADEVTKNWR